MEYTVSLYRKVHFIEPIATKTFIYIHSVAVASSNCLTVCQALGNEL